MHSLRPVPLAFVALWAFAQWLAAEEPKRSQGRDVRASFPTGEELPPGAVMRLGTTRFRENLPYAMVYSPDGKLLASAGYGGVVLLDAQSGKKQAFLKTRLTSGGVTFGKDMRRTVYRLAFSSDGRYLAAACDGETIVWELATREASYLPGDKREWATDLVGFTLDNRGVFTADANEIQLRDRKTGKVLKRWEPSVRRSPKENQVRFGTKAISADGKIVVAYVPEDNRKSSLRVWDTSSGEDRRINGVDGLLALRGCLESFTLLFVDIETLHTL